ncbi:MAG: carboxypeptidase regulatory-like domain-containing protein, partial [Pseudomonadota bacterium]|nr:carboxypeptidase regulatory-like domain-containing protein [Pseudomonadota bacterium]
MSRFQQSKKPLWTALFVSTALLLTACNDDDDKKSSPPPAQQAQTETLTGVAATGKPFAGKIEVVNAKGQKSTAVDIAADGTFTVTVPKGAPYLLKAFNDATGEALYSYAAAAGRANVTQLTTAALFDVNAKVDVQKLYEDWAKQASTVTQASVLQSAAEVVANLKNQMLAAGLTAAEVNALNVFNYEFEAKATNKFDNLLDLVKLNYNCGQLACEVTYEVDGQ